MKRRLFLYSLLIITSLVIIPYLQAKPKEDYQRIEVIFDAWGIPHIYSETDEGAFYGLGYMSARQRGFQMYYTLRIIQGRLAEVIGNQQNQDNQQSAVAQDRKMRILGFYRKAQTLAPHLNQESLRLLNAYAEGVNDFFLENQHDKHPFFIRYHVVPEPWTPADSIALWWYMGQFLPPDGLHDLVSTLPQESESDKREKKSDKDTIPDASLPQLPDESSSVVRQEDMTSDWLGNLNEFLQKHKVAGSIDPATGTSPKSSQAWVIGQSKSKNGSAVLCSNPRLPVLNPSFFYEYHIAGKSFDARGIGVPGCPILLNGWNKSIAWGATALGVDQADLFLLKTDPQVPNSYLFNDISRPMHVWEETIQIKDATPETIILKETHLGPVVNGLVSDVSPGLIAVLQREPLCNPNPEMFTPSLLMMRARDTLEFSKALENWHYPAMNLVYGDINGNIGYWMVGAIPIPSRVNSMITPTGPISSATNDLWKGYIPFNLLPHVLNPKRGYIISANHRPVESFYPFDLGIHLASLGDTERSWRLRERLDAKPKFTAEEMLELNFDTVNPIKREFLRISYYIRDIQNVKLSVFALQALAYLTPWYKDGTHSSLSKPGAELALLMDPHFNPEETELIANYGTTISGYCLYFKTTKKILQTDTNHEFSKQEIAFVDRTLSEAWQKAIHLYGDNPSQWPANARVWYSQNKIRYFQTLDGFLSLDPQQDIPFPPLSFVDNGAIHSQLVESYLQWVPLHSVDHALSMLPISPVEQWDNWYYALELKPWGQNELHPAPLSREAIEKYSARSILLSAKEKKSDLIENKTNTAGSP